MLVLDVDGRLTTVVGTSERRGRPSASHLAAAVSSSVEQFQRRVRNWNLHSSIARLAPVCTLSMKLGCFLQKCTCLASSVSASWSHTVGVPRAAEPTAYARDRALFSIKTVE